MMWRIVKNGHPDMYWDGFKWDIKAQAQWFPTHAYLLPMFGRWEQIPDYKAPKATLTVEWSEGALVSKPKK